MATIRPVSPNSVDYNTGMATMNMNRAFRPQPFLSDRR
ncbi:hypothetical protein SNOG_12343 [Parastagonospora nodorum SN15]|uniref:Uncharacterized protein n=1 Tax=Phaeosphaeria nodorum (strain SN15 / ATCC MYA-4574 / FGSC 10173) TaxID=321614 RepID=Q0U7C1_PHANO|nr:hypothetical protein SNOG_12343 [Parastagonospora nodorum SN15]EAT80156.1 hypothetical protein SNOG_12343 [Parastagonospora nodorum SN15]